MYAYVSQMTSSLQVPLLKFHEHFSFPAWYSDKLRTGRPGFYPRQEQEILLFLTASRLGPN
jgi:hypothetical protein